MGTLREVLNRLRWHPNAGSEAVVLMVRSREGGAEKVEEIAFDSVVEILPGGVTVADGTFLPYHRVVLVRSDGEVLWRSGGR
jgi:uncharacterized protein (UPF0248 family)